MVNVVVLKNKFEQLMYDSWSCVNHLKDAYSEISHYGFYTKEAYRVTKSFIEMSTEFNKYSKENKLDYSIHPDAYNFSELTRGCIVASILVEINRECSVILSLLNYVPPTQEEKKELEILRKGINDVGDKVETEIIRTYNGSLDELEFGHSLAASLICGKIVSYMLDQINIPKEIREGKLDYKIEEINKKIELNEIEKSVIIKINKKMRDDITKKIKELPTPEQTLGFLTDTLSFIQIYSKYIIKTP